MTKVLVADDYPVVREGLTSALRRHPDIEVVGVAVDGIDALEQAHRRVPDVLLLDLRMPRLSGLMVLARLSKELPQVRVLVVSVSESAESVVDAIAAGASGFITMQISGDELCAAVLAVARGEAVVSPSLVAYLMKGVRRNGNSVAVSPTGELTGCELEVLRLVAQGHTDRQISSSLYISPRTVQSHLSRIRDKTGIRRRTQLACWATEHSVA